MLAYKCGPVFAGLTAGAIGAYSVFTIGITQWRTRFRQVRAYAEPVSDLASPTYFFKAALDDGPSLSPAQG